MHAVGGRQQAATYCGFVAEAALEIAQSAHPLELMLKYTIAANPNNTISLPDRWNAPVTPVKIAEPQQLWSILKFTSDILASQAP
jgi:hypothetical protein